MSLSCDHVLLCHRFLKVFSTKQVDSDTISDFSRELTCFIFCRFIKIQSKITIQEETVHLRAVIYVLSSCITSSLLSTFWSNFFSPSTTSPTSLTLVKSGSTFWGFCPFSSTTASNRISPLAKCSNNLTSQSLDPYRQLPLFSVRLAQVCLMKKSSSSHLAQPYSWIHATIPNTEFQRGLLKQQSVSIPIL